MTGPRPAQDAYDTDPRTARELVAGGPSQVTKERAMRVRDVDRPTAGDMSEAEEAVQVVHRHWKPQS